MTNNRDKDLTGWQFAWVFNSGAIAAFGILGIYGNALMFVSLTWAGSMILALLGI